MPTPLTLRHAFALAFLAPLAIAAACSSGDITLSSYDTSCRSDADCIAVAVGGFECCPCPNAAINKSDQARYQADLAAQRSGHGVCALDCIDCPAQVPVCSKGTCALAGVGDATGGGGTVACGTTTCTGGEVCVMDQFEGGALVAPDDAGACPSGDANQNGQCQPLPTYRCAPAPAGCASGLSCGCAQSLCDSGYTCASASAGQVQCFLMAP